MSLIGAWLGCAGARYRYRYRCGGGGQQHGETDQAEAQRCRGGQRADQQGATSVAELTADLGGSHGLPEPFFRCGGGQVGEAQWSGQATPTRRPPGRLRKGREQQGEAAEGDQDTPEQRAQGVAESLLGAVPAERVAVAVARREPRDQRIGGWGERRRGGALAEPGQADRGGVADEYEGARRPGERE